MSDTIYKVALAGIGAIVFIVVALIMIKLNELSNHTPHNDEELRALVLPYQKLGECIRAGDDPIKFGQDNYVCVKVK